MTDRKVGGQDAALDVSYVTIISCSPEESMSDAEVGLPTAKIGRFAKETQKAILTPAMQWNQEAHIASGKVFSAKGAMIWERSPLSAGI